MKWQEFFLEKLYLKYDIKILIIDKYFLIEDFLFNHFLKENNIHFKICDSADELISSYEKYNVIFYNNPKVCEIPSFIAKKYKVIDLNEDFCFCKFDKGIANKIDKNSIKRILIFSANSLHFIHISSNNFDRIIESANKFYIENKKEILSKELNKNFELSISNENNPIKIAPLYSDYIFCNYKLGHIPNENIINKSDEFMYNFISSQYQNSFYSYKTINRIVHKIKGKKTEKFALICFDGMGIVEWKVLENYLNENNINIKNVDYYYSLLPTMTLNCRTSLFSGKIEECYNGINENKEFEEFFNEKHKIIFLKPNNVIGTLFENNTAVKLIYNFFDDFAHSFIFLNNELSKNGYLELLSQQIKKTTIAEELTYLKNQGFDIFISSDHGVVVSKGNGIKIERHLIEKKCTRGILAPSSSLLQEYSENALILDIPFVNKFKAIVAKGRTFFGNLNSIDVTHGGISIEELIVPFIEVG